MIPPETVELVLQTAVIEDVIGDYVELKKSGSSLRGLSPFTNEKTPSFYVLPAKGIFKCFSSGKGGSVVNFLMESEKLSFPEAIKQLASRYGIAIEEEEVSPERRAEMTERESLIALNAWAQKWFTEQLHESESGRAIGLTYFESRGFRKETLDKFNIGYCPDDWEVMSQAALDAGYVRERLLTLGLAKEKDGKLWDFFKGRVMFPIRDVTGRFIAFGGRTLRADKHTAKYFNSPESALYLKGDVLYGIHLAKPAITKNDRVLLVEGYTDVMALHQAGIENVVSSSGTALTDGQIKLIKRFTKNVSVLFDGDAAGISASLRGVDLLLAAGMNVQVVLFPDGDDPDSYSKKVASDVLHRHIETEAKDFVAFKMDLLAQQAGNDPVKRSEMIHSVLESIAAIPDGIQQGVYLKLAAEGLAMPEEKLQLEVNKILRQRVLDAQKAAERKAFRERRSQDGTPSGMPSHTSQEGAPRFQVPGTGTSRDPALEGHEAHRRLLEKDLIRLMLLYGTETLTVTLVDSDSEAEKVEGETAEVQESADVRVTFAELTLHHLEDQQIIMQDVACSDIIAIFKSGLESGRIPDTSECLSHSNPDVHVCVTDALLVQNHVSDRWGEVHQIYPAKEADLLHKALMDSIHHLQLNSNRAETESLQGGLKELAPAIDSGDETAISAMKELLKKRKQLDLQKRKLAKYFGAAILP